MIPRTSTERLDETGGRGLSGSVLTESWPHADDSKRWRADPLRPDVAQAHRPHEVSANPDQERERDRPHNHQNEAQGATEALSKPAPRPRRRPAGQSQWRFDP